MAFIYGLLANNLWLLQEATKDANAEKTSAFGTWGMWILIVVMIAVFYFLLIRPQRKKAQQHDQMVSKLKKGDEVVTIGGMYGVIKKMTDENVVIEVDKGVRIRMAKSAISKSLTPYEEEEEEEAEEETEETGGKAEELEEYEASLEEPEEAEGEAEEEE